LPVAIVKSSAEIDLVAREAREPAQREALDA
jgi:hypothetical protein